MCVFLVRRVGNGNCSRKHAITLTTLLSLPSQPRTARENLWMNPKSASGSMSVIAILQQ
jgi:hypothetical protein